MEDTRSRMSRIHAPLQCTSVLPPCMAAASINCLALRVMFGQRPSVDVHRLGTYSGNIRMRFCSSVSSTFSVMYWKFSGKRGRTAKASFASRMHNLKRGAMTVALRMSEARAVE